MTTYDVMYDKYSVHAEYDEKHEITHRLIDGKIKRLDKPVTGAWSITAKRYDTGLTVHMWQIQTAEMLDVIYNRDFTVDLDIE